MKRLPGLYDLGGFELENRRQIIVAIPNKKADSYESAS